MSSDSEGCSSTPEERSYSRGSSISTGLREEYEELLQYAVVTPKFDGKINNETVTRSTQITSTGPHVTSTSAAAQVVVDESPSSDDKPSAGMRFHLVQYVLINAAVGEVPCGH